MCLGFRGSAVLGFRGKGLGVMETIKTDFSFLQVFHAGSDEMLLGGFLHL